MGPARLSEAVLAQIERAVTFYQTKFDIFERFANQLLGNLLESAELRKLVHSYKIRAKDPERLRDKLERMALEAIDNHKNFTIGEDNLFVEVEDLAGIRLLHLYTKQMSQIHPAIMEMLTEHRYTLLSNPVAYTWDFENEQFFKDMGFTTECDESLYTSVHYYIEASRRTRMRCELQVRTLAEEVWGEVSHTINYPYETESVECREQLKVLARIASGNTRLVDSIFASFAEHERRSQQKREVKCKRQR